ncbi:hypothetical protein DPX16_15354 [Anabarilius grahami]|uniref:Uncharacterized protein n=1 Tax=Anabarilius grahami TaxID=495550 RepID=A0A3N0XVS8_ANAGA|nr:hypothetical protein DPX16_15354 [Anabarilius grahami]
MSQLPFLSQVIADHHESSHSCSSRALSRLSRSSRASSRHITPDHPESCHVLSVAPKYLRSVLRYPSVRDTPLVSARAAGIPKSAPSSPPAPELIPCLKCSLIIGVALWCIWARYTTDESPEVAAYAAKPSMRYAAEPYEAAVLASAPCMVVVSSNTLSACCVVVEETITESSLFPDVTTVEPPEVSVASTYQPSTCPVTAIEAVFELSSRPVTAIEAVCELSSLSTLNPVYHSHRGR